MSEQPVHPKQTVTEDEQYDFDQGVCSAEFGDGCIEPGQEP